MKFPIRYLPPSLTKKQKEIQARFLQKSRKAYKKGIYYTRNQGRNKIKTYNTTGQKSKHLQTVKKVYHMDGPLRINQELIRKTGCSRKALEKIVNKGEGAYYSSGSRPNQTGHSWGYARLASAITGQKAAVVDYSIIDEGCHHKGKAFRFAKKAIKKFHRTLRHSPKTEI
jgi:Family of unknown function (DUF5824)